MRGGPYDNFLPGISMRCLVVMAGFTMSLSLVISLKQRADIQLDMSTSQGEMQTCVTEAERIMKKYALFCTLRRKRNCGICDTVKTCTVAEGEARRYMKKSPLVKRV